MWLCYCLYELRRINEGLRYLVFHAEAKQEFDGNCSIQVYSVQACIPKDPAALWNAEFVQAEELFKQPSAVDNCLRDNRYDDASVLTIIVSTFRLDTSDFGIWDCI